VHWFYDESIGQQSSQIAKSELVHLKSLRISAGEQITISSGKGYGYLATVLNPLTGEIRLSEQLQGVSGPKFHLIQAIAKGGRDEAALQSCTELGIQSATALQAERSISRWEGKLSKNIERWQQIAISAIKQSQQLTVPEIKFAASVSDLEVRGVSLVLDPRSEIGIASVEVASEYSIAVGPEGGFSDEELDRLVAKGFRAVRLGDSVLRTSNAGVVALACLKLASGALGKDLV
jgi:16S rRNA (uracil1498-N3)-methyltransferase